MHDPLPELLLLFLLRLLRFFLVRPLLEDDRPRVESSSDERSGPRDLDDGVALKRRTRPV